MPPSKQQDTSAQWPPALILGVVLLVFLMTIFFLEPTPTESQQELLHWFFAILAGFFTFFMGNAAFIEIKDRTLRSLEATFTGGGGVAVFVLVLLFLAGC